MESWYERNKERLKIKHKLYYQNNKERLLRLQKEYNKVNSFKIKEYQHNYFIKWYYQNRIKIEPLRQICYDVSFN